VVNPVQSCNLAQLCVPQGVINNSIYLRVVSF
jgi:hypothetical protein